MYNRRFFTDFRFSKTGSRRAIEKLTKAIRNNPNDTAAHTSRGQIYSDIEDYDSAIEDCSLEIEKLTQMLSTAEKP